MFAILTLSLLAASVQSDVPRDDPAIVLKLSDDFFFQGERVKVRFKAEQDGYVVVLRMDGDGRIRPLFPVNPGDSNWVRGGREFEVRGRGDRDAFTVDERDGVGYVMAAVADAPFDLTGFARGNHWDLRALAEIAPGDDPEITLLDIVDSMATTRFEYDLTSYTVGADRRSDRVYRARPWFGRPRYYNPWFYGYDPFYGPGVNFRFGIGLGSYRRYRHFW